MSADYRPIDESHNLTEETDDRDRGYGVVIEDGEVVQLDPEDGGGDDSEEA